MKRLLLVIAAVLPLAALAQAYPSKPVRMIVPFPPGGPADIFARGLAQGMHEPLGQPVVIENIGGAGGGSITHPAGELLKAEAKVDLVHVPYKGAAPAVNDLLGGQVQMGIFDVPVLLGHIRAGKLKALAVTSATRTQSLPDVPTTAEMSYPSVTSDNWYGLVVPAATPADLQKPIHPAAMTALRPPAVIEQFARVGGVASPGTPQDYAAFLAAEQAKWSQVVSAIGFKEN